ncbi:SAF domain-containing protein [Litorivivens sp.]|uniref:SAF domain-containing protein n=3 Tax=Litorivivens sp. TaxID=2020868 RepID=UPI003566538B
MKRKLKGSATGSIVLFLASSMLASVLGIRQIDRMGSETAWVASSDLKIGEIITPKFLEQRKVKTDGVVLAEPRALIGKRLTVEKKAGEPFNNRDVVALKRPSLAEVVPAGRVLYTLAPDPQSIPVSQLRGGDRLDVLVTSAAGVRTVARDVRLVGVMRPSGAAGAAGGKGVMSLLPQKTPASSGGGNITSLVVAVYPESVYPLASIHTSERVSLVLHGARDLARGEPLAVQPVRTHHEVEMVQGLSRSTVRVRI